MAIQINGTSGISGVDGSAGTPALQGTDSNTGISFGTDTVNINTGGTTRATFDSSGRLGIGTSSPSRNLTVSNTAANPFISIEGSNTSSPGLLFGDTDNNAIGQIRYDHSADKMQFSVNGAERAVIDSSGRVGIGSTPDVTLHVATGNATGYVKIDGGTSSSATNGLLFRSGSNTYSAEVSHYQSNLSLYTAGSERARIDSSGRLLVGTSTARTNAPGGTEGLLIEGTSSTNSQNRFTQHVFGSSSTDGPYLGLAKTRSTSIGGNTVVQSGDELGGIYFQGADGSDFKQGASIISYVDGTPGANDMPGRLVFSTTADGASSPTERMRISANGNIRFDPNANGITIYNFNTGAGNSTVKYNYNTGALTYDTSNRYVKDNIVGCPYGIAEIKQLRPRKYFRIDDQVDEIGFIADEVSEVMPEFVSMGVKSIATKNPEDTEIVPLAVNYEKMTAVLTKALQEAITRIETLETRVAQLEGGAS